METSLTEILDANFEHYYSKLDLISAPTYQDPVHYSVQHGESAFQYASRLARQYGEWFYFNGTALVFGQDKNAPEVKLNYGLDLKQYGLELILDQDYKYYSNDYLTEENHQITTVS